MKLIDELTDIYLEGVQGEMHYLFDRRTERILLDAPTSLTGEPEIDLDDEEYEMAVEVPVSTSAEMYQLRAEFAQKQTERNSVGALLAALEGRKPFRQFQEAAYELGLIEDWYTCERKYAAGIMEQWLTDNQ
ncbi:UPF0158 family protein [Sporosarcina koreensis]|uniref:UPF0158 family protein n=1 Tax=Sporosarcina koreensis TaxID=334735 RepID=UPI0005907C33|nr:UPF0158 family protein [Sporosarcina koreensis]